MIIIWLIKQKKFIQKKKIGYYLMNTKKISLLVISVLILSSIGGVMAADQYAFDGPNHSGSCHDSGSNIGEAPPFESENGSIYKDSTYTEPGINVNSTVVLPNSDILVSIWVYNFTEAVDPLLRRDPAGNGSVTVQISPDRGNNDKFYVVKGLLNNDDAKADANGYWHTNDELVLNNETGDSLTYVNFTVRTPNITTWGGVFQLRIDVLDAYNKTAGAHGHIAIIYASAAINIYVLPLPPPARDSSSDDDRDLWKEATIPGYMLIVTIGSIFSVSAVLILLMKKKMKKTSRIV